VLSKQDVEHAMDVSKTRDASRLFSRKNKCRNLKLNCKGTTKLNLNGRFTG
jgi:hypothetical protein